MRLDPHPTYRRAIVAWYDSDAACVATVLLMLAVLLFSLLGVSVARGTPEFRAHLWVPVVVAVLSGGVLLTTLARLIRRHVGRFGR